MTGNRACWAALLLGRTLASVSGVSLSWRGE